MSNNFYRFVRIQKLKLHCFKQLVYIANYQRSEAHLQPFNIPEITVGATNAFHIALVIPQLPWQRKAALEGLAGPRIPTALTVRDNFTTHSAV